MEVKFSSISCALFLVLGSFYLCEAATSEDKKKCADGVKTILDDLAKNRDEVKPKLYKSKCAELKNTLNTCRDTWEDIQDHASLMGVYIEICLAKHVKEFMNLNLTDVKRTSEECDAEINSVMVKLDTEYLKEMDGNRKFYKDGCITFRGLYQDCKAYLTWDEQVAFRSQYMQSCESKEIKEWYKSSSIMLHGGFFSIAVAVLLSVSRNSV